MAESESDFVAMDSKDLVGAGILAEINRRVLHPIGLAMVLQSSVFDDGIRITGVHRLVVVDGRKASPEGLAFPEDNMEGVRAAAEAYDEMIEAVRSEREAALGAVIQPVTPPPEPEPKRRRGAWPGPPKDWEA